MQKIISLFQRNYDTDYLVRNEVVPGAEWVLDGEGVATRKWDGTCCLVQSGALYRRYDAKNGKTAPQGFIPAQDAPDPITGHWPGWLLVGVEPDTRWHREAFAERQDFPDGTYELCGPRVGPNPEHLDKHYLLLHGADEFPHAPRAFDTLKDWFKGRDIEGIVWHRHDGRMVKIKKRDFGMERTD